MTIEHARDAIRTAVRDTYAKAAEGRAVPGCCGQNPSASLELGYAPGELVAKAPSAQFPD